MTRESDDLIDCKLFMLFLLVNILSLTYEQYFDFNRLIRRTANELMTEHY